MANLNSCCVDIMFTSNNTLPCCLNRLLQFSIWGDTDVAITIGQTSTNMLGESGAVFGLVLLLFSLLLICVGVCVCVEVEVGELRRPYLSI